jgi:4-diphosphocytidyl-2-C-methyl-D-erythritol kinase
MEDMTIISFSAPEKINLSLRIQGKRSDGYHEVETLIAPLSLADEIEISLSPKDSIKNISLLCNEPSLPIGTGNLCVKAAIAFQEDTGLTHPLSITLLKRIPHGAGLGGGSSNAAAILVGLNNLFNKPLVFEELHQIATATGSDVPFFLDPQPRWCRGRGELLEETIDLPSWRLLLIKPPFPVSTIWAYQQLNDTLFSADQKVIDGITIVNDLEPAVFKKYLLLPVIKNWLQDRIEVLASWMSGSGSTIVAALPHIITDDQITALKKALIAEFGETVGIIESSFLI